MTVIGEGGSRSIHLAITTNIDPTSPDPTQLNLRYLHCTQGEGTNRGLLPPNIANMKLTRCIPGPDRGHGAGDLGGAEGDGEGDRARVWYLSVGGGGDTAPLQICTQIV